MTEQAVAELLGVTVAALRNARCRGVGALRGLKYYKLGGGRTAPIRYDPRDVDRYLEQCARGTLENAA